MESRYLLRSGFAGSGSYEVEVTPESAGWGYSSLKIISLEPAGSHRFRTSSDEVIVLPLSGSAEVEVDDARCMLDGRLSVFEGPTDIAYVGTGSGSDSAISRWRAIRSVRRTYPVGGCAALYGGITGAGRAARRRAIQPPGAEFRHTGHAGSGQDHRL